MKSTELRIGNWIDDTSEDGGFFQVEGICKDKEGFSGYYIIYRNGSFKCSLEEDELESDLIQIKPIPLTEEILLKCGFKKDLDGSFQKNDVSIFLDKRFKTNLYLQTNDSNRNFIWFGYECKIQHLHQLQNLYFALTGEELNIEL